jgi:hypothetical protein
MLHIAIAGHRTFASGQDVENSIDLALNQLTRNHQPPWVVYSSLAEGADRLVLERLVAHNPAQLVVPLPLPESDYIQDFQSTSSQKDFYHWFGLAHQVVRLPVLPRPFAYWLAGLYMLDHCDLLIAVWDGLSARAPGGTGDVVAEARRRAIPQVWIKAAPGPT